MNKFFRSKCIILKNFRVVKNGLFKGGNRAEKAANRGEKCVSAGKEVFQTWGFSCRTGNYFCLRI